MIDRLMDIETWRALLQDDFSRGYLTAVSLMLALLLVGIGVSVGIFS